MSSSMSGSRKLPLGRAQRLIKMAGAGARVGANLLVSKGSEKAAQQFAESLGTLRGLAAKIGQTLSYVDGVLPEGQRETYEKALGTLRAAAPSSSPEAIVGMLEEELGGKVSDLFAEWGAEPFASASIGQVHRARLHDGRLVAVKVQHPGIDKALENDLGNVSMFEGLVSMVGPRKLDTGKLFEVVRQRFMEELDYRLEATHQRYFQGVHRGDPKIRIPAVVEERSSRRVLTTELVHGQDLEHAARAPIERRAEYARVLWRFVFKGNLVGGRFNADPHPGNYIFHDDGGITFLDFGCVQPLDDADLVHARRAHAAALVRDEQTFRDAMRGLLELQGGTYQEEALRYTRRCFEPLFASPFHMTRDYVGGLFRAAKEMKREMFAKDKSFVPPPPNLVFMNRLQFGFYSVLARLDAVVDFAAVEREFVAPLPETRASSGPELALK